MKLRLSWTPQKKINSALLVGQIKRNGYAITQAPMHAKKKKGNLVIGKKNSTGSSFDKEFPRTAVKKSNLPALTTDLPALRAVCVSAIILPLYI